MTTSAIIVAAGRSRRMGGGDKLFVELAGRPLIAHTWARFDRHPWIDEIVMVTRPEAREKFEALRERWAFKKPVVWADGGAERQDSVWNGLAAVSGKSEIVAVQDAARPCTPDAVIDATLKAAQRDGAAVAACRVTDTIKESGDGLFVERTLDRGRLWAAQTPQAFQAGVLRRALEAARKSGAQVTDDTAACEWIGQPVRLVESAGLNPKATTPADWALLEILLKSEMESR